MRPLSTHQLLGVWEHGLGQPPTSRALLLLGAADRDHSSHDLAMLSIGQRDSALLELRTLTFGPLLHGLATCPTCDQQVELELAADDLQTLHQAESGVLELHDEHYHIQFRLPNSLDLVALRPGEDLALLQRHLAEGCIIEASVDGERCPAGQLPEPALAAISEKMALADPLADIELMLHCPACMRDWSIIFDIVTFFWREIDAWAHQMLRDIHILASAYGWSEHAILSLNDRRRAYYLELVGT